MGYRRRRCSCVLSQSAPFGASSPQTIAQWRKPERRGPMAKFIAQVSLQRDTGIPADVVVNTWHFESDNDFDTNAESLAARLQSFYSSISGRLGAQLSGDGEVNLYDYDDPKPRVPKWTEAITVTPNSGVLPAELCICLSMDAAMVSGGVKARRRGRIFLGPLSENTMAYSAGQPDVRVAATTITEILDAAETLATDAAGTPRLAVYSPQTKATGGTDDQAWNDVVRLSVDDAFDIQRRRGTAPLGRTSRDV